MIVIGIIPTRTIQPTIIHCRIVICCVINHNITIGPINNNISQRNIKNDNNNDSYIFVKYENYKLSSNSKLLLNKKHENILNHAHVKYMMNSQH